MENYGFEVERRVMEDGATTWVKIGFVPGAGTSSSPKDYSFVDQQVAPGRYACRIKQIDHSGAFSYSAAVEVDVGLAPREFTLSQNYPNPFNPTTTIEFTLPEDGRVTLKIYDLFGREVATLMDEELKAGYLQQATLDGSRLASGIYFARLEFGKQRLMRKLVLMK